MVSMVYFINNVNIMTSINKMQNPVIYWELMNQAFIFVQVWNNLHQCNVAEYL